MWKSYLIEIYTYEVIIIINFRRNAREERKTDNRSSHSLIRDADSIKSNSNRNQITC